MIRLLVTLLLFCFWLPAQAGQFAVVLSGGDPVYRDFVSTFKAEVAGSEWKLVWEGSGEQYAQSPPAHVDLVVSVGTKASRATLLRPDGPPVMMTLLTRSTFENLKAENPGRKAALSALYLDQPLSRQLAFIQKLLPETRRVVTLVSPQMATRLSSLRQVAGGVGMRVDGVVLGPGENLVQPLERLLEQDGVFLALPDSTLFTRDNIRPFLLTTYRYQRPVVVFSPAFVQAGALAALHTTPAQLARELGQWLIQQPNDPLPLPSPRGPSRFSVEINSQVARSLKLDLPGEDEILRSLGQAGKEKP